MYRMEQAILYVRMLIPESTVGPPTIVIIATGTGSKENKSLF